MRFSHNVPLLIVYMLLLHTPSFLTAQQSGAIPRYVVKESTSTKIQTNNIVRGIDIVPYIVATEDTLQSYIQDNAISVWVNVPSLRRDGDTLTAVIKRVMRYDIAHTLSGSMVTVDVLKFNTRNDTFARVASLDKSTNTLALNTKQEWEKTTLDLDMNALYHYIGFLFERKSQK